MAKQKVTAVIEEALKADTAQLDKATDVLEPEVTKAPAVSVEDEILQGSEEDQLIGKEPEPRPKATVESVQELQTQALLGLSESIKQLVSDHKATKQVPYHEIKPVTPWNPEGKRNRFKWRWEEVLQHGRPLNPMLMTEEEIGLWDKVRPGRYWNRKIEIQRSNDGRSLNLTWPNARIEHRMEFNAKFPSIGAVLQYCINEKAEKDAKRKAGNFEDEE